MERNIYLENVSVEKAKEKWLSNCDLTPKTKTIDVRKSKGKIVTKDIFAKTSSPYEHRSAMDGIAVLAKHTSKATKVNPIKIENYKFVDTGDIIPKGYNAVIKIEDINMDKEKKVEILNSVSPWENIRTIGESMVKGDLLLTSGRKITSFDLGVLIEGGIKKVDIISKPSIGVIPTGSELINIDEKYDKGKIYEFNSHVIKNLIKDYGAKAYRNKIIKDDYNLLKEKIKKEVENRDVVVIIAGTSAGSEDYTSKIINELGKVYVHGISIKPGGPTILGKINNTPIIGLPGYPVAAAIVFRIFGKEIINKLTNQRNTFKKVIDANISKKIVSNLGHEEYIRVKLAKLKDKLIAKPLKRKSGIMSSLSEADGLIKISEFSEGISKNKSVEVEILKDNVNYGNTLLISGSNDLTLDILKKHLSKKNIDLVTTSSGSLGGIMDLRRDEAHIATSHLLDSKTGNYNVSYIKKYLDNKNINLINLVYRKQGFIINENLKNEVKSITDLTKNKYKYINRQKGSGTRVLFDYLIKENNIKNDEILGYDRIEYSHMTLAALINSNSADIGLGVLAAANAFDLDFIPIKEERYDLIIPKDLMNDKRVKALLSVVKSNEFKNEVKKLKGYNIKSSGCVINYE
ncbi:MAG: molybdopterin biosynthesis protein [Bacillota bacterium]